MIKNISVVKYYATESDYDTDRVMLLRNFGFEDDDVWHDFSGNKVREDHPDHGGKWFLVVSAEGPQKADHLLSGDTFPIVHSDLGNLIEIEPPPE